MNFTYNPATRQLEDHEGYARTELTKLRTGVYRPYSETAQNAVTALNAISSASAAVVQDPDPVTGRYIAASAYNVLPSNFVKFNAAIDAKINTWSSASTGGVKILFCGDSITMGAYCTGGDVGTGLGSYPKQLKDKFRARSIPASQTWGNFATPGVWSDGRVTVSGGWIWNETALFVGFGGSNYYHMAHNGTGSLTYTPRGTCDTIRIWFARLTTGQSYPVTINGVAQANLVTAGSSAIAFQTYTVTKGTANTVVIGSPVTDSGSASASADGFILGIEAYVAGAPEFQIYNAGCNGSKSTDWSSTVNGNIWSSTKLIAAIAPDLTVIALGVNDIAQGVALATSQTSLQTIITQAKVSGDVLVVAPFPSQTGTNNNANMAAFYTMLKTLATTNNCAFIDTSDRLGGWDAANAKGWEHDSVGHLHDGGFETVAQAIYDTLRVATAKTISL